MSLAGFTLAADGDPYRPILLRLCNCIALATASASHYCECERPVSSTVRSVAAWKLIPSAMRCSMAADVCKLRRDYRHIGLPSCVSAMTIIVVIFGVLLSSDVIDDVTASSSSNGDANARRSQRATRLREFIAQHFNHNLLYSLCSILYRSILFACKICGCCMLAIWTE